MKLKSNMLIFYLIFPLLFISSNALPTCELELKCIKECSDLKNNNILKVLGDQQIINDPTNNNQYSKSLFDCLPGDEITFTITAFQESTTYKGGFIAKLKITGTDNNPTTFIPGESTEIISCTSSCPLNSSATLQFTGDSNAYNIFEFSVASTLATIKIPYKIKNIANDGFTYDIDTTTTRYRNINFEDYVKPEIEGADKSKISIKIKSIQNNNYCKLYRGSNPNDIIIVNSEIPLTQGITFAPIGNNFGYFTLKYIVIVMSEELEGEHSINFNVCYINCATCDRYDSFNPEEKKCKSCISENSFFVEGEASNYCFSLQEISDNFEFYYYKYSPTQYKKCHISCKKCSGTDKNCSLCNNNYYKVEDPPTISTGQKCYYIDQINSWEKYYLSDPPYGDTYNLCTNDCKTCKLNSDNCFSCNSDTYFFSNDLYKCKPDTGISNNYYKVEGTYLIKDTICSTISYGSNKKKCSTCLNDNDIEDGYHLYKDFCYLKEEVNYEYGINLFYDASNHKFDTCLPNCLICKTSSNHCLKCSTDFYFDGTSTGNECHPKSDFNATTDNYKYYLPKGSDTYLKCIQYCNCELKNDYCLGCSGNYIFKEDENKCYPSNTKIQGYYMDKNIYKKCHNSCLTCEGEGTDKCKSCAEPYYPFKLDNTYMRCITQIEKKKNSTYDNYFLQEDPDGTNKKYIKCDVSCLTCEDGVNNNQCIECNSNSDYAFFEGGGKICKKKDTFFNENGHDNFYFNEVLNEFRKCHKSCKSCKDGDRYNNCYECNTNYVFIDDPANGKCVLESIFSTELKNYYLEEINNHQKRGGQTTKVKVYKKCPENCDECNKFEDNPLKCKICKTDNGYYKRTLTINNLIQEECYNDTIMNHYYYNYNKYSPSNTKCLTSTYETQIKDKCLECHNKYGYYSLEHAPETCQNTIPEDHYVSLNNLIIKCPYECASCSEGPTSTSTNCDVCKEEFPPSLSNPKNCEFRCDYYQYKFYDGKYCTGEKECPELVPYLIKENATCVQKCDKVSYYGICLDECPSKTINNGGTCQDSEGVCNLYQGDEIREHLVDLKKDISPLTKRIKKYYKYFSNTISHVDIYHHYLNEYTMIIYQRNSCVKELLPDYISIDFPQDCSSYSQSQYIIVLFLVQRENKYNQFYYQLYDVNNLDNPINNNAFCPNVKVEIPHNQANFDIEKYETLYKKQIYLTNHLENFFHDMCFQNYEDGKDIVIKQRRQEYYQDPYKICIDNCNFITPPDFTYRRALCTCSRVSHSLNDVNIEYIDYNINYIMGDYFYDTDIYVFEHLKCFKHNFEDGNIFKNMGSYMIIIFFLFEIISMIIYGVLGIDSIKMFIIDFIKGNPPKKIKITMGSENESNNENNKNKDNKSNESNKNTSFNLMEENHSNKKYKKKILNNNFVEGERKDIKNSKTIKSWEKTDLLIGRSNNLGNTIGKRKGVEIYQRFTQKQDLNEVEEKSDINTINKNEQKNVKASNLFSSKIVLKNPSDDNENFQKHKHVFTDYELNSMELYDAEIKDKRSFCYFYKLQMLEKQEFYRAFCINEPLYPISIKIINYVFNLSLNLVFNALFYTEDQIYEGVKSLGKNIGYIFLRAFYTFLVIKGIDYLINLLIKNSNYLRSLFYRRKREKQLRVDSYKSLKNIKATFCVFFVIVIVCDALFWIYITSFCYCYNGEQAELLGAFLVTQFYMEIYCVVFGLYLAVFRFIGLKCKATTCYKLSQTFLDT